MSVLSRKPPLIVSVRGPVQLRSEKQGTGAWCQGMAAPDMPLPCATKQSPGVLSSHPLPPGYLVPAADLPGAVASRHLYPWSCRPSPGLSLQEASMLWNENQTEKDRLIGPHTSLRICVRLMVAEGRYIYFLLSVFLICLSVLLSFFFLF